MISKSAALAGLLLLIAMTSAGCGKQQTPAAQAGPLDLSKVTLVLGDQVNFTRTKAEAAGVLEGVPYKIEWASFQGAAPLFEAVRSGDVDTAPAADTPVLAAAAGGAPIKLVAAAVSPTAPTGVAILVPPGSPIKNVADLKGRSVIVSSARGSVAQYVLFGALREAGLTEQDLTIGFMLPGDASVAFSSGKIEAWATFGTYQASAELHGARVLRNGVGIYSGTGLIAASDKALADPGKRAALADVLQRLARANEWVIDHPAEYAKVFAKLTGLPDDVVALVLKREHPTLVPVDAQITSQLQKIADTFYEAKLFPIRVDAAKLADTGVFPPP
ncbi:ABC transporter substrate-binding protein [Collimonas sp.]|jgi:sulfonate transport system substrate-binding protein|uniref:ABC transporter substrate-binding protein n=1 Tax=Collimonas sp. TaxID=1963772 RepID=UPI002CD6DC36|nr:ABC transporter substrate-binding protein [Collimonas sp.]HWX04045.1 ABC transporter substrate-binding protein [Collimonas sp.]